MPVETAATNSPKAHKKPDFSQFFSLSLAKIAAEVMRFTCCMTTRKSICQTVAAETAKTDTATPQEAATPRPQSPFTDFSGLVNYLPMYKPRTLRALVKKKILPHIRPPGTRKLGFYLPAVESAMRRFEKGSVV